MALAFDLKVFGSRELERQMRALPRIAQDRVMKTALRKAGNRAKNSVLLNLSGNVVQERTGRFVNAMERLPVRLVRRTDNALVYGWSLPSRAALGLPAGKGGYYPTALEYDARLGPKAPIRKGVNSIQDSATSRAVLDMAGGIEREWRRTARRARAA